MGIFSAEGFEKGYEQGLVVSKAEAIKSFTIEELVAEIEARAYERGYNEGTADRLAYDEPVIKWKEAMVAKLAEYDGDTIDELVARVRKKTLDDVKKKAREEGLIMITIGQNRPNEERHISFDFDSWLDEIELEKNKQRAKDIAEARDWMERWLRCNNAEVGRDCSQYEKCEDCPNYCDLKKKDFIYAKMIELLKEQKDG